MQKSREKAKMLIFAILGACVVVAIVAFSISFYEEHRIAAKNSEKSMLVTIGGCTNHQQRILCTDHKIYGVVGLPEKISQYTYTLDRANKTATILIDTGTHEGCYRTIEIDYTDVNLENIAVRYRYGNTSFLAFKIDTKTCKIVEPKE